MAIENFLTYTLEDINGKLTTTSSKIEGVDVDSDEDVWRIKDKGVDHFDALNILFELFVASTSGTNAESGIAIANTIGTAADFVSTDITVKIYGHSTADYRRLYLTRGHAVASDYYVISYDTLYYCTMARVAGNDTITVKIYSDSARTNLLDTLSVAGFSTTKYRYSYGFINRNIGSGGRDWDGYVQNMDLQEVILSPTSIPSAEAFGTPKLNLFVTPSGIVTSEAFGTAKLNLKIAPSGIVSAEAFGTLNLLYDQTIETAGISSEEVFGSPAVSPGGVSVAPSGISSEELFGLPKLNLFVTPSGIVTGEAFGAAQLNLKLILTAIASAEAFGTPTLGMILLIRPSGLVSAEAFGSPLLIVILAKGTDMKLPPGTPGEVSIPSKEVSLPFE